MVLAVLLATALVALPAWLPQGALEIFDASLPIVAAALIFQMVWWMRRHGASLKATMEADAEAHTAQANWLGIAVLAAVAVGREGAETVIFLWGAKGNETARNVFLAASLGLTAGFALYLLLARGVRLMSWRAFFRVTEILLLLLGGALLVDGAEKLVGLEWLPALADPLWNTSRLLDEAKFPGSWLALLAGYRATPSGIACLLLVAWWAAVILMTVRLQPARRS